MRLTLVMLAVLIGGAARADVKVRPNNLNTDPALVWRMGGVRFGPNGAFGRDDGSTPGTVSSVNVATAVPGLSFAGGPITGSGTITFGIPNAAAFRAAIGTNDATNLGTGTIPDARLSAYIPRLNAQNTFTTSQTILGGSLNVNTADNLGDHSVAFRSGSGSVGYHTAYNGAYLRTVTPDKSVQLRPGGNLVLSAAGNGTVSVSGSVVTPALKVTGGTLADGKVLTSDADGNATWRTVDNVSQAAFALSAQKLQSGARVISPGDSGWDVLGDLTISGGAFNGDGSGITNLNASNLTSGTVADARLSANIPRLDAASTFTAAVTLMNAALNINRTGNTGDHAITFRVGTGAVGFDTSINASYLRTATSDKTVQLRPGGLQVLTAASDGTVTASGRVATPALRVTGIAEYADNAAALAGGLAIGDVYRTGDALKIVH